MTDVTDIDHDPAAFVEAIVTLLRLEQDIDGIYQELLRRKKAQEPLLTDNELEGFVERLVEIYSAYLQAARITKISSILGNVERVSPPNQEIGNGNGQ